MFHIFCDFFFSRGVKFRPLFFWKGEKTAREREREREKLGVRWELLFFPSPNESFFFISSSFKKNKKYVPIKRALFARYESSRDVKTGENAWTRSLFSPRAPVLLYFFCFDSSDAREYVSFFCQVGWQKRKEKARLWWKTSLGSKTHKIFFRWKKERAVGGGRKKNEEQKSKFSSRLNKNLFFFFSFLSILCARWHFFTNLLSYHPNAPKNF